MTPDDAPRGRRRFGPPRSPVGAYFWAAVQLPRALLWQLREPRLRTLAVFPAVLALGLGLTLSIAALIGAEPLHYLLATRHSGAVGNAEWFGQRLVLTLTLLIGAAFATWQLQGAIASAALERMALYVQREVNGDAPDATLGPLEVVARAVVGLVPRVTRLVSWLLSTVAALTLVLVPVVGPVLVIVVQTVIGALFLSHSVITDNRVRLGLPRRLLVREPAMVLGLATALTPLLLLPPLMIFAGGPVAIAGALVAVGTQRRRGASASMATDEHLDQHPRVKRHH
jgi:uncharacterized protein involved in cysteine biosynthesis